MSYTIQPGNNWNPKLWMVIGLRVSGITVLMYLSIYVGWVLTDFEWIESLLGISFINIHCFDAPKSTFYLITLFWFSSCGIFFYKYINISFYMDWCMPHCEHVCVCYSLNFWCFILTLEVVISFAPFFPVFSTYWFNWLVTLYLAILSYVFLWLYSVSLHTA